METLYFNKPSPIAGYSFVHFSWEIKIVIWWKIVLNILMQNWKIWLQVIKDIQFQIVVSGMKWDKKLKKWSSHIIQDRFLINDFWLAREMKRLYWSISDQSDIRWENERKSSEKPLSKKNSRQRNRSIFRWLSTRRVLF